MWDPQFNEHSTSAKMRRELECGSLREREVFRRVEAERQGTGHHQFSKQTFHLPADEESAGPRQLKKASDIQTRRSGKIGLRRYHHPVRTTYAAAFRNWP